MEHHESAASFKISMFFKCILYTRNKSQGCPTRLNATNGATRNKIAKNVHVCARFLFFMIGLSNNGTFSSFTALSFWAESDVFASVKSPDFGRLFWMCELAGTALVRATWTRDAEGLVFYDEAQLLDGLE